MQENKNNKLKKFRQERVLLGLFVRKFNSRKNNWELQPVYKRIVIAFAVLALMFWCACSATVYVFFKYIRGYEKMSIADAFCVPFNITEHRKKLGEFNIEKSKEFFKQKRFSEGFMALTSGVYRSPENLEARKMLSAIHMYSLKNPDYASAILEQKLSLAFENKDVQYLSLAMLFFSQSQLYEKKSVLLIDRVMAHKVMTSAEIIKVLTSINSVFNRNDVAWAEEYFDRLAECKHISVKAKEFTIKILAANYLKNSNATRAMAILKKHNITTGYVFEQVRIFDTYENGREIEAILFANKILKKGDNIHLVYNFFEKVHNDFGNYEEARSARRMSLLTSPDASDSQAMSIVENGDVKAVEKLLDRKNSENLLPKIIRFSIKEKKRDVLLACLPVIKKSASKDIAKLTLAYAEACLRMGETKNIETLLLELKSKNKELSQEVFINELLFVNAVLNNVANEKQVEEFKKDIEKKKNVMSLLSIFKNNSRFDTYIAFLTHLQDLNVNVNNLEKELACAYFDKGDIVAFVNMLCKNSKKIPVKYICEISKKIDSDSLIMLTDNQRETLRAIVSEAEEEMKNYKKIYSF